LVLGGVVIGEFWGVVGAFFVLLFEAAAFAAVAATG